MTPPKGARQKNRAARGPSTEDGTLTPAETARAAWLTRRREREQDVRDRMRTIEVQDEAKRRVAAKKASKVQLPELATAREFLAMEFPGEKYLIDGLWPAEGNVMLTAQRKAGKTTTVGNVCRSLVDGDPFMGYFQVMATRRVALFDFEMTRRMLQEWTRDQGIRNQDDLLIASLRGAAGGFDIRDDATRARWATLLQDWGTEVLILDPLLPVLSALNIDVTKEEVGRFIEAFDELKVEADIKEGLIVQHTGHIPPIPGAARDLRLVRPVGHSRQVGWADSLWAASIEDPNDPSSLHYFGAFGRDVVVKPGVVVMDDFRRQTFKTDVEQESKGVLFDGLVMWLDRAMADDLAAVERGEEIDHEPGWRKTGEIEAARLPGFGGNGKSAAELEQAWKAGRVGREVGGRGKPTWYWSVSLS